MACLFCPAGAVSCAWCDGRGGPQQLGWAGKFARLRGRRRQLVQRGLHPTGYPPGPNGSTCWTCVHLVKAGTARAYLKCGLDRAHWTRSAGTDLRAHWPGCARFGVASKKET